MRSSIAQPLRTAAARSAIEVERDDLRDLLAVVLDALDVHGNRRTALLDERAQLVTDSVREVLGGEPMFTIQSETDLLRRKLAEDGGCRA